MGIVHKSSIALGTSVATLQALYNEEVITANPEFNKLIKNPQALEGGLEETEVFADWAKLNFSVSTPLSAILALHKDLLTCSNLKESDWANADNSKTGKEYKPTLFEMTPIYGTVTTPRIKFNMVGIKGKFSLSGKVGDKIFHKTEISSYLDSIESKPKADDDFTLSLPSTPKLVVLRKAEATTVDGNRIDIKSFELTLNNELGKSEDTGGGAFHCKEFKPKLKLKIQLTPDNANAFDQILAGAEFEIIFYLKNMAGNDVWMIKIPKARIIDSPLGDDDGLTELDQEFDMLATNGGDNLSLIYINQI